MRYAPYALVGALLVAGGIALFRNAAPPPVVVEPPPPPPSVDPHATVLPPNHPMIGSGGPIASVRPNADEPAGMTWTAPSAWKTAPNPNAMRLATYVAPGAGGADSAEVSVSRAGGSVEQNIQRWIGQFDDAGQDKRSEKTVRGLKVTIVEVAGTFRGGGMMGAPAAQKKGWALLAAIVETPGSPYFVKIVGPEATVRAARAPFDELVASVTPAK